MKKYFFPKKFITWTKMMTHTLMMWAVMAAMTAMTAQAQTHTFIVSSNADDGSSGTLRWAIEQANAVSVGSVIINVQATGTIVVEGLVTLLQRRGI